MRLVAVFAARLDPVHALRNRFASSSTRLLQDPPSPADAVRPLSVMEWFGRARMGFTHSPTPVPLQKKDGGKTDIRSICKEVIPPCQLNPLLFNGHMQTFWTATKQHGPPVYYKRKIFDADNDDFYGTFAVDFATDPFDETDDSLPPRTVYFNEEELQGLGSDDTKPQLVVLHGLSGGSHEIYLRHVIAPLVADRAWEVCVVNSRGCAKSAFTSGVLYNARATWDIRQVSSSRWSTHGERGASPC